MSHSERELHLANFAALEAARPDAPLAELRRKGLERFVEMGYPTTRMEDWRATNVQPLAAIPFTLASLTTSRPHVGVDPRMLGALPGWRLVFVNGRHDRELSRPAALPRGVTARTFSEALGEDRAFVEQHLGRHASWREHAFTALNTAFLEEGIVVRVGKGAVVQEPLHVVFITASGEEPLVAHPRVLVVAEERSQAVVIETHAGTGRYLSNAVTEIVLEAGAVVEHVKVQREGLEASHLATIQVHQDRASVFVSHVLSFGAALARTDVNVQLAGEGSECRLSGLQVAHGTQHLAAHTFVDHATPHGASRQLYKSVLAGRSRGIFHGRVLVRKDAQKTDAQQGNHALLLSESALADTKPQLEIHADDVKCTHGATIGQLDDDAVFYLRSRGLSEQASRGLLTHAFAQEVVTALRPEALRAEIEELLAGYLPEAAHPEIAP